MNQLTVYQAIDEMRRLSREDIPFSFTFMSYSDRSDTSHGIVEVQKARLKNRTKEADWHNSEMMEEYIDLNTFDHRRFYHCTLMSFNGNRLKLT
jgi:hypothetical protein